VREAEAQATARKAWLGWDLLVLCRPWQWPKNAFVLAPLLFGPSEWSESNLLWAVLAAFCFCLWSSGVYAINDALDAASDARHPRKQNRPVASGRVPASVALGLATVLIGLGVVVAVVYLHQRVLIYGMAYVANSLAYCLVLRRQVILDVITIAIGFVLRLLTGCAAISIYASSWLMICGFSLAMMLGFGKRRLEIDVLELPEEYRSALRIYDVHKLNMLLSITAAVCLTAYMLYTVSPTTIQAHGTDHLIYTVPFVAYGIFRYIFEVQEGRHDSPVEVLFKDPVFALNGLLWIAAALVILWVYGNFPTR
jgi:4-hydroxybenzoate polyprenyltransferase